jgi:curved DNA-binding protein CbpA
MKRSLNPYAVLGVAPTATMAEIELAYRQGVRACHPDLHQGSPPDELARAEAMTRDLNEAMALVRAGWRPLPGSAEGFHYDDRGWGTAPRADPAHGQTQTQAPGGDREPWNQAFRSDPETDWFGNPIGRKGAEAVDCPICGYVFTDPVVYRSHLANDHRVGPPPPREREAKARPDRLHWLIWVPAPTFWLFVLLVLYWAIIVALIPWPWVAPFIWIGVALFGFLLNRAVKNRHTW